MDTIDNKKVKTIIWCIVSTVLLLGGLFVSHKYILYKELAQERRKVVYEIYGLYNSGADAMQDALLKVCIGDSTNFSFAKAERAKK
jgi:hypothetical protein